MPDQKRKTNPYVGPRPFQRGNRLYGRDREIRELLNLLIAQRIILLNSPSGAGKTSLIQAGLIPQLEEEDFYVFPIVRVNLEPPRELNGRPEAFNRYVYSVLVSLEANLPEEQKIPPDRLIGMSLVEYLDREPADPHTSDTQVLVFDQFEEILTVNPFDREGKEAFFAQLGAALRDRRRWALFAMREDFVAALDAYTRFVPTRLANTFRLDLLGVEAARQAIQKPAEDAGVPFTDEAAQKLVDDLRLVRVQSFDFSTGGGEELEEQKGPYVEPVQLQVVCRRLWEQLPRGARSITEQDVVAVGDVNSALSEYYADRVRAVSEETGVKERAIRDWVDRRLITDRGLRNQVLLEPESIGLDTGVIGKLIDAHLVRQERRGNAVYLELAHDRLVRPIRDDNIAWKETHLSVLQRQATRWWREGQKPYLLLHGEALAEAEAWADANPDELTGEDRSFLEASQQLRAREDQERVLAEQAIRLESAEQLAEAERLRAEEQAAAAAQLKKRAYYLAAALVAALILLLAAAGSAWYAIDQRNEAQEQRVIAEAESKAAQEAEARAVAAFENETAARLEVARQRDVAEEQKRLAEERKREAEQERKIATARQFAAQAINLRDSQPELALLLSLEGNTLAEQIAAETDQLVFDPKSSLLDVLTGSQIIDAFQSDHDYLAALAFNQDGGLLASGDYNGNVILWDLTHTEPVDRTTVSGPVFSLGVSPDGDLLLIADYYGGVYLWDIPNKEMAVVHEQTFALPQVVSFSPDGRRLAAAGNGLHLGSIDDRALDALSEADYQNQLAFSQDGDMLAAVNQDGFIEVWDTGGRYLAFRLDRQDLSAAVLSLAFTPADEQGHPPSLIAVEEGGRIIAWDMGTRQQRRFSYPASGFLFAYNPARSLLANDLPDGKVQVCRLDIRVNQACITSRAFVGSPGRSSVLAISANGRLLAAGREDGSIILWQLTGNALTGPPLQAHTSAVVGLAFQAGEGNSGLVSGAAGEDSSLVLWDVKSHEPEAQLSGDTRKSIIFESASLAYSPDGKLLASGDQDGEIRLWDTETFTLKNELSAHLLAVQSLAFSPNGRLLAAGSQDYTISIWDPAGGQLVYHLREHYASVSSLAFSPDGKVLASAGMDGRVILWDVATGQVINAISGMNGAIYSLAFHPDGRFLAYGGESAPTRQSVGGSSLFLWDLRNPGSIPRDLQNPDNFVSHVAFSHAGNILASAGPGGRVFLWDLSADSQTSRALEAGEGGPLTGLNFSLDDRYLIVAAHQGLSLWDVFTLEHKGKLPEGDGLTTVPVVEPHQGRLIAAGNDRGEILFWDLVTADLLAGRIASGYQVEAKQEVSALAVSPDGKTLASGGTEGSIILWDLASRQSAGQPILAHGKKVTSLAFSPDGSILASGGMDGLVRISNPSGQEIGQFSLPNTIVSSLAFSPTAPLLAVVFTDSFEVSSLYLWDLANPDSQPELIQEPETEDWFWPISSLAFDAGGNRLGAGRGNGMISLLDVPVRRWLPPLSAGAQLGQETAVKSLAFSGDGTWLASGMADGSLILWDAQSLRQVGRLTGHTSSIDALAFSPDRKALASAGADTTVLLWEVDPARWVGLACRAVNRNLSWVEWTRYIDAQEEDLYKESCPGTQVPDDVVTHYLEKVKTGRAGSPEVMANLTKVVEWSIGSKDTLLLEDICTFGIASGYDRIVRPACNRAAELLTNPWDRANFFNAIGDTVQAEQAFVEITEEALSWDDEYYLNEVCWQGSLQKFPEAVLPACERGVEIASPEMLPLMRDSRGLARALMGDYTGAIEDFRFLIDWLKGEGSSSASSPAARDRIIATREGFIEALEQGQNPIDDQALQALAEEEF